MDRPNIVLIIADQMRGDCLSCDGHPLVETPALDELAGDGTHFRHAYTACPSCIPARATLMTGMNQWHTGILGMGRGQGAMPCDYPHTLAGELTRHGYRTHLVGKGHFNPQRAMMGFQSHELDESGRVGTPDFTSDYRIWFKEQVGSKPVTPDDHGVAFNSWMSRPWHLEEYLHPTSWTMTRALHFLANRDQSQPFFLNISFARPHSPYVPPQPYFDMYIDEETPQPHLGTWSAMHDEPSDAVKTNAWRGRRTDRQIHRARAGYYGDITFIDTQIGRLVNYMSRTMRADFANTLFVFVADHGDMLGDHNMWRKTYAYEGSARIPFIVRPPMTSQFRAARHSADEPVELQDVMPTILDVAGIPSPKGTDGRSLLPLTQAPGSDWRSYVHGEHSTCYSTEQEMQYVTDGRRKFVWLPKIGVEQFFDLEEDPGETNDLVAAGIREAEVDEWRQNLVTTLAERDAGWVVDGKLACPDDKWPLVSPWKTVHYQD
ncbi:MAG: arylsulfatase [Lentisphaerae bacterium]|jgi:arylsulfatase|nr:arylsulfatase [Lentisphaerota bacterium]MBT7054086.1 arylsulfatase [Lentisphaerota bacterium]MBT7845125.1 arylsulfatase [Lentisphaerota bacterium]